ncbi:hypothetical protein L3i22_030090 [Actinoplanes sp. L3-i22]|nr:hypothetical protein L3i22_030090 [Actinoplanes sp. L3-i22]
MKQGIAQGDQIAGLKVSAIGEPAQRGERQLTLGGPARNTAHRPPTDLPRNLTTRPVGCVARNLADRAVGDLARNLADRLAGGVARGRAQERAPAGARRPADQERTTPTGRGGTQQALNFLH